MFHVQIIFSLLNLLVFLSLMKRFFDLIFSALALLILAIPLLILISLIYCRLGSPVFFCQSRPGLYGKPFTMIKFRTMTNERGLDGRLLPEEIRLTPFGRFLRVTSLDELPELLNVLKGDMSFVGPRPLLMEYLSLYNREQARRHLVRPGITGWAQVNGRNSLSWDEKFKLDIWYLDHCNFFLDLKILLLTINRVISRQNVNTPAGAIMPKFTGNHSPSNSHD